MSAIVEFIPSTKLLFQPGEKESLFTNRELRPVRLGLIGESELRFWRLSARAVSPKLAMIEIFVPILFLAVALVGVISCFAELSHLLESDAVGHVATRVVSRGVYSGSPRTLANAAPSSAEATPRDGGK